MAKWVYLFKEGNAQMRNLLGGKGANLAEMTNLGLPIPQGFTVTTEACIDYYTSGKMITEEIQRPKIRGYRKASAGFCAFRCQSFDARYDGHDSESWTE